MRSLMLALAAALLATGPAAADAVQDRLPACLTCHGDKGQSSTPQTPSLGAQQKDYLLVQLFMFREKLRTVEIMNQMTQGLSDDDLRAFADVIAKLSPPVPVPVTDAADAARIARAQALVTQHRCNFCHAPNFAGQAQVPRIADQREDYLLKTLRDYKSNTRHGYDTAMAEVVAPLKDEDFADLAYYLARVK
jgi:cytochrome c553